MGHGRHLEVVHPQWPGHVRHLSFSLRSHLCEMQVSRRWLPTEYAGSLTSLHINHTLTFLVMGMCKHVFHMVNSFDSFRSKCLNLIIDSTASSIGSGRKPPKSAAQCAAKV